MRKGFAPLIIISIIAAGLITTSVAGFFILKPKQVKESNQSRDISTQANPSTGSSGSEPSTNTLPAQSPLDPKDTANWQTYFENIMTYRFINATFKYPPDWKVNTSATDNDSCDALSIAPSDLVFYCGTPNFPPVYIKSLNTGERNPLSVSPKVRCTEIEELVINSQKAIGCKTTIENDTTISENDTYYIFKILKGTKIRDYYFPEKDIAFWYTQNPNQPNLEKEFDQILSTFQFLE